MYMAIAYDIFTVVEYRKAYAPRTLSSSNLT